MRSFEQYDEICKYFTEGKQRDNNANEIQMHLQLYNLSLGEYLTDRYALWLDFRMIDENELHGMGRKMENASEGITLQIEKKAGSAGALNAYIYLIMDAQLNIQNSAYLSVVYSRQAERASNLTFSKCLHLVDLNNPRILMTHDKMAVTANIRA